MSILKTEKIRNIGIIKIDNPPLNLLNIANPKIIDEFNHAFASFAYDDQVKVIIFTGTGDKAFIAGADISGFTDNPDLNIREMMENVHQLLVNIKRISKPTIAVLNGLTLGGGCEISLVFDFRIAEEHVKICLPEITLGFYPAGGGTRFLPQLIGEAKAKEMIFLGEPITAKKAKELGLVNKIAPKGEGLTTAIEIAEKLSSYSLPALSSAKRSIEYTSQQLLEEGFRYDVNLFVELSEKEDFKEGINAFLEKRKPNFKNN